MKCDELKVYHCNEWHNEYTEFYLKSDVDAAIDELKSAHHKERHEYINMIAELNAEINRKDGVGQRWFERCMKERAENVKLKRALWISRARNARNMKAYENLDNYTSNHTSRNSRWNYISSQRYECWFYAWDKVERKCLKKAGEYK